jgi:hypothetical protein
VNDLEQRLRERLQEAAPVFEPVPVAGVAAGVRRRRSVVLTAAGAMLAVGAVVAVPWLALTTGEHRTAGPTPSSAAATTPPVTPTTRPRPAATCPSPASTGVQVDYVDFLNVGGRSYLAAMAHDRGTVPASALTGRVGVVRCTLATIGPEPTYRPQDGDAGFLRAGTPLYGVTGYPAAFRIAAPAPNGRYRLYEVDTAPDATVGADLLGIGGKVLSVEIRDGEYATHVLARLTDPTGVHQLVADVLAAPVDQRLLPTEAPLFVRFTLTDGTAVQRAWFPTSAVIERGITLPPAANALLRSQLPANTPH